MVENIRLTAKQYVEGGGMLCPACGHKHVGYTYNYEHEDSLRNFTCHGCKAKWRDTFKLTGYTDLVKPESKNYNDSGRTKQSQTTKVRGE